MTDITRLTQWATEENILVAACRTDLERLWSWLLNLTNEEIRDTLLDLYPALITKYADMSATHAADLYDELRVAALGTNASRFTALAQPGYSDQQLGEAVRETARHLWQDNPRDMIDALSLRADEYVKQGGRNTLAVSSRRDPAKPRFARVPLGATCAWCRMLASRGFVYASSDTAGDITKYHPDCDCMIAPAWGPHPRINGYDHDVYLKEWNDSGHNLAKMRSGTPENRKPPRLPPEQMEDLKRLAQAVLPDARLSGLVNIRDADQARRQLESLELLLEAFPEQRSTIRVLAFQRLPYDWGQWSRGKMILATDTYTRAEFIKDILNKSHRAATNTDPAAYVVAHEFAHTMINGAARKEVDHLLEDVTGKRGLEALSAAAGMGWISLYGESSLDEAMAECFARMVVSASGASEFEKRVFEILVGKEA